MKENETGKLWPGVILLVGQKYQGMFKGSMSELFDTYHEAEGWILTQKEEFYGHCRFGRRFGGRQDH